MPLHVCVSTPWAVHTHTATPRPLSPEIMGTPTWPAPHTSCLRAPLSGSLTVSPINPGGWVLDLGSSQGPLTLPRFCADLALLTFPAPQTWLQTFTQNILSSVTHVCCDITGSSWAVVHGARTRKRLTVSQKGKEEAWGLTGKAFPDGVDVGREAPVSEDHKEKDGHYEKTLSPTSENLEAK